MKLKKLGIDGLRPVIPVVYEKNNNIYFNVTHGTKGYGLWMIKMSVDSRFYKPDNKNVKLELIGDDFNIKTIRVASKEDNQTLVPLKDSKDNYIFTITKDQASIHKHDLVLFWDVPNFKYHDFDYKLYGYVSQLALGFNGKDRQEMVYKSPAPVLEITGNATLLWSAKDNNNETIGQIINIKPGNSIETNITNFTGEDAWHQHLCDMEKRNGNKI